MAKGKERYRPMGLALKMINECMLGDMITTEMQGAIPQITGYGVFKDAKMTKQANGKFIKEKSRESKPCIQAYAFKNKKHYSLILMNLDLKKAYEIKLSLPGKPEDITSEILAPESWLDNNEYDMGNGKENVRIEPVKIKEFKSGTTVKLPPSSMQIFKWQLK